MEGLTSAVNNSGRTPLEEAQRRGNEEAVEALSEPELPRLPTATPPAAQPAAQTAVEQRGEAELAAALLAAAKEGNIAELQRLIAGGASVHWGDSDGDTALHIGAVAGQALAIKTLIASGARVKATNNAGRTPLMLAAVGGHEQVRPSGLPESIGAASREHWFALATYFWLACC